MSTNSDISFDYTKPADITPQELHQKYFDLVWYARRTRDEVEKYDEPVRTQALERMMAIEEKYPQEIKELNHDIMGEWFHGFNSGMLACLRLLDDAKIYQTNWEDFPFLDS